jgi:hypothetical protein
MTNNNKTDFDAAFKEDLLHKGNINSERKRAKRAAMSEEEKEAIREKNRQKRVDMKSLNPAKYEESLAKMRQYHKNTRDQRLAKQKEYRQNRSEEHRDAARIKHNEYSRTKYREMKDAEEQLILCHNTSSASHSTANIPELQRLADKRQRILAHNRNNKSRKWVNIRQLWDENNPCQ